MLSLASPCVAQSDTVTRIPTRLCWRGRPAPECTTFWITEFGIDANMSSTQVRGSQDYGGGAVYRYAVRDFDSRLTWTVGPMFNTGPYTALGGTLSLSPVNSGPRIAVEGRRRWWALRGLALDLSAGGERMRLLSPAGTSVHDEYGLTGGAYVVGGDLINVNGRVDLLLTGGKARAGTSFGVAGGSVVAVVGTVTLGLLVLALLSASPWD
jgi:hypothetical protein